MRTLVRVKRWKHGDLVAILKERGYLFSYDWGISIDGVMLGWIDCTKLRNGRIIGIPNEAWNEFYRDFEDPNGEKWDIPGPSEFDIWVKEPDNGEWGRGIRCKLSHVEETLEMIERWERGKCKYGLF